MVKDYEKILDRLATTAQTLGFSLALNEDFLAIFASAEGWTISLEGDPIQTPAFTIEITRTVPSGRDQSFAVWLLMRVFRDRIASDLRKPSLDNQLRFLNDFARELFVNNPSYLDLYKAELESAN